MEITPEPDARMCLNHSKYEGFHKVPPFWLLSELGVLGDDFGPHFGRFLGTLGTILMVLEGSGDGLEF